MRIAYALAGEGRGHTVRALTLANGLIERGHEIAFFTCGDALQLLRDEFGADSVFHLETPRFVIRRNRVAYIRTGFATISFFWKQRRRRKRVIEQLRDWKPDALITDFEPTFSGVAKRLDLPLISFNSQRFSLDAQLDHILNRRQRVKLIPIKVMCRFFAPKPDLSLISKGFNLQPNKPNVRILGPMLRPQFHPDAWTPKGTHVIAYMRASVLHHLPAISQHADAHGLKLKLYGHYPETVPDNVECCPISNEGFIQDMLTADWMIQTAGTQLLGEVGCIGIPSICIPEPGQVEQEINAALAKKTFPHVELLHPKRTSVEDLDAVLSRISTNSDRPIIRDGSEEALLMIDNFLTDATISSPTSSTSGVQLETEERRKSYLN